MSGYIGTQPVPQATQTRQTFTATSGQTSFATAGYTPNFVDVYMNGVHLLDGTDYTATNGSDVVLTSGAAAGDTIEVVAYSTFEVVDQNFTGDFSVDTNTLYVDSTNNLVGIGTSVPQAKLDVTGDVAGEHGAFIYNSNASGYSALRLGNSDRGTNGDHLIFGGSALGFSSKTGTGISFNPSNAQAMRIDPNGYTVVRNNMQIGEADTVSQYQGVTLRNAKDSGAATTTSFIDAQNNLGIPDSHIFFDHYTDGASTIIFGTTPAGSRSTDRRQERMRIDPNGYVFVNTQSNLGGNVGSARLHVLNPNTQGHGVAFKTNSASGFAAATFARNANNGAVCEFFYDVGSGAVGRIDVTSSATSYVTSSDYRLKEDVQPMVGASDRVLALNPVNFAWKVDGTRVDGFLAHEAQEVVPEAVTGAKDAMRTQDVYDEDGNVTGTEEVPDYQGIDQSKLVPLLTAALQEAIGRIETLEADVAALKGASNV